MKRIWNWIYTHPTRITGFLLVIFGSLQANSAVVEQLLTPQQFSLFTIAVGAIVSGLGFLNTKRANGQAPPK